MSATATSSYLNEPPRTMAETVYERALRRIAETTRDDAARAIADQAIADVAKARREAESRK